MYGDGDAKNARSSLYLRRNSARLGLGCREAQGEATVVTNLGRHQLLLSMEATNRERACRESEREMESLRHGRERESERDMAAVAPPVGMGATPALSSGAPTPSVVFALPPLLHPP